MKSSLVVSLAGSATLLVSGSLVAALLQNNGWESGIPWKTPAKVDPGEIRGPTPVPSDAIVLFDGTSLDAWRRQGAGGGDDAPRWQVNDDGSATVRGGSIETRQSFGDVQLHLEFMTPLGEDERDGQGKGNSGLFFIGPYEVQILDSFENETYVDGQAAAIYKQSPPLVNASRAPGEWQAYDVVFEAPHFDADGELEEPAYLTVFHNGVVVQHRFPLKGATSFDRPPAYETTAERGPISLQDHSNPVKFRNIWVRELTLNDADRQEPTR